MSQRELLQENIRQLEKTINMNCWSVGYMKNCEAQLEHYKKELSRIQD